MLWFTGCGQPTDSAKDQFRSNVVSGLVSPEADAWIHSGASYRNNNYGSNVQSVLDSSLPERTVIRFSPVAIQNALAGEYVSATLRIHVYSASNFGAGQTVELHRLIQPWEEDAVTFNCAVDSNTGNTDQDCTGPTQWDLEPQGANPWIAEIATTTITDSSTVLEFDVTAEVAALLDGTIDHYGWAIALEDGAPGFGRIELRE